MGKAFCPFLLFVFFQAILVLVIPMTTINILAVGDIVGKSGLDILRRRLRGIIRSFHIDFTVVNGENSAGTGLTPANADDIFNAGADVITLGNHAFSKSAIFPYLEECQYILRPQNFAPQSPGRGFGLFETAFGNVLVINLVGRCGMNFGPDNPFFAADLVLSKQKAKFTLVDMHAEATSEKLALCYYLDGRVSAVWGTHTHVQTSDASVFPKGTGYITDLGMTGPARSVLGVVPQQSIDMFLGNPAYRFETASGPAKLEGAVFSIDRETGLCQSAEAIRIIE